MVTERVSPMQGIFKLGCVPAPVFPEINTLPRESVEPALAGGGGGPSGPGDAGPICGDDPAWDLLLAIEFFVVATYKAFATERDLIDCGGGLDPAVDQWLTDAEGARSTAIETAMTLIVDFPGRTAAEVHAQELAWSAIDVFTSDSPGHVARVRGDLDCVRAAELLPDVGCEAMRALLEDGAVLLQAYIDLGAPEADSCVLWAGIDDSGPTAA